MTDDIRARVWDECLERREIIINDRIDHRVVELVVKQIMQFNEEDDEQEALIKIYKRTDNPIKIYLNTPGGTATDSLSIVSAIESSKTPVHTIALGMAMSGGFLVLISGHERYAQKYSSIMWHDAQYGEMGSNTEIKRAVADTDRLMKMVNKVITSNTKLTQKKLDEIYGSVLEWTIGSEEAIKLGIIDAII